MGSIPASRTVIGNEKGITIQKEMIYRKEKSNTTDEERQESLYKSKNSRKQSKYPITTILTLPSCLPTFNPYLPDEQHRKKGNRI